MNDEKWRVLVVSDDDRYSGSYIQEGDSYERIKFKREHDDTFLKFKFFKGRTSSYFTWAITKGETGKCYVRNTKHKDSDSDFHPPNRGYKIYCEETRKYVDSSLQVILLPCHKGTFNMSNITPTNRSAVMGDEQCAKEVGDKIELSRLKLVSEKLRSKSTEKDDKLAVQKSEIDKLKKLLEEKDERIATQEIEIHSKEAWLIPMADTYGGLECLIGKMKPPKTPLKAEDTTYYICTSTKTENRQNA